MDSLMGRFIHPLSNAAWSSLSIQNWHSCYLPETTFNPVSAVCRPLTSLMHCWVRRHWLQSLLSPLMLCALRRRQNCALFSLHHHSGWRKLLLSPSGFLQSGQSELRRTFLPPLLFSLPPLRPGSRRTSVRGNAASTKKVSGMMSCSDCRFLLASVLRCVIVQGGIAPNSCEGSCII